MKDVLNEMKARFLKNKILAIVRATKKYQERTTIPFIQRETAKDNSGKLMQWFLRLEKFDMYRTKTALSPMRCLVM